MSEKTFPSNAAEALALIYVEANKGEKPEPETLADMYLDGFKRAEKYLAEHSDVSAEPE